MSSRLGNIGRRYLDSNAAVTKGELRTQAAVPVRSGPPYGGYCPDLTVAQLGDAEAANAFIPKGFGLTNDDGYERVDSTRLPLGDSSPPAATGVAITGIFSSYDNTVPGPVRLAVTAQDGSLGRLYELSATTGQWTHRAAQDAARDMDAATGADDLVDWAFFPPAVTAASALTGAAIFTDNSNQIMRYPSTAAATTYDIFDQSGTYKAKSVEVWEDRVMALNVEVPTDGRRVTRLIWTNKGASASFALAGTGAGSSDFLDVKGQGLAIRKLGIATAAVYFDSAVVLIQRTGVVTDPFRRLYTSHDRGLLSTHSVVNLGSGVHFGLFTDGWFYLSDTGQWEEVGLRSGGNITQHKWHKTFYELLDWENRSRVVCTYDGVNRLVRIAFPSRGSTAPDTVWNYDLLTDTVWPDDYGDQTPNIWGNWLDIAETGTTIDALPGTIDSLTTPIDDYAPTRGRFRIIHGTTDGLVFKHDPTLYTRDGASPTCLYQSHLVPNGDDFIQKTAKRLVVGYRRPSISSPTAITATFRADSGQASTSVIHQTKGTAAGSAQNDWVSGQVSGINHGWSVSVAAPVTITTTTLHISGAGESLAADD